MSIWVRKKMPLISYFMILVLVMTGLGVTLDAPKPRLPAKAAGDQMLLLWDDAAYGAVPAGWSDASATYGGYFLRGDTLANVGTSNAGTHNHTVNTVAFTATSTPTGVSQTTGTPKISLAAAPHSHTIATFSMDDATILPVYRNLMAITCDAGIPTTVPQYAIAIFDGSTSPTGFSDYTAQDGKMVRIDTAAGGTGGATTHTHSNFTIISNTEDTTVNRVGGPPTLLVGSHTHNYIGTSPSSGDNTPLHTQVDLRYATNASTAIPVGMIAMFTGNPGSAYDVISDGGEAFGGVHIEAQTSYATGQGNATHTHALNVSSSTVNPGTIAAALAPTAASISTHSHTISGNFSNANNVVPYMNVVFGKRQAVYTPQMNNWRWYADDEDITPGTAYAAENTTAPQVEMGQNIPLKLRINITETGGAAENNSRKVLQYSTDGTGWTNVGETGSTTTIFRYYNGGGADNGTLPSKVLSDSSAVSLGIHNESNSDSPSNSDHPASTTVEFEYTIEGYSMSANVNYIFRLYDQILAAAIPLATLKTYPTFTSASSFALTTSSPSSVFLGTWALGAGGKHTYTFVGGEEITNRDNRGLTGGNSSGWTCSVEVTTQLQSGANQISKSNMYWISYTTDITPLYDAPTTGMSGNSGELMTNPVTVITVSGSGYQGLGGFTILPTIEIRSAPASGDYTGGVLTFTTI